MLGRKIYVFNLESVNDFIDVNRVGKNNKAALGLATSYKALNSDQQKIH